MLGTVLGSGVGAGVGVDAGVGAGLVSACATGCVGASVVGGRWVVWFCGAVGAGCTELGCPTAGVFTWPVAAGLLCGVVTDGVVGAVATMFCVGVGATGLADTALSRSLPPPPPQAASITLSAVAVQVVRRIWGCLAAMLRLQGATYCTRLTMEKSYSWPWAVPDVSAKKHQSQQGEGGGLSCGSDDGCRRAVLAGSLSPASILPAAFSPRAGLLEELAVFQADGGEAAAPDAAGVQGNEVGLQFQAQG